MEVLYHGAGGADSKMVHWGSSIFLVRSTKSGLRVGARVDIPLQALNLYFNGEWLCMLWYPMFDMLEK